MAKFTYNNTKDTRIEYTLFKLHYRYHSYIFYKKNIDPCFWFKTANKLIKKLKNLMVVYRKNF